MMEQQSPTDVKANPPSRHRPLYEGEKVRTGDKYLNADLKVWSTIGEEHRGTVVGKPSNENGFLRYCRPVHPNSRAWYIDLREDHGDDEHGIGSVAEPFATLEGATRRIEDEARQNMSIPYGIIWDVRGLPILAYDLIVPESAEATKPEDETTESITTNQLADLTWASREGEEQVPTEQAANFIHKVSSCDH